MTEPKGSNVAELSIIVTAYNIQDYIDRYSFESIKREFEPKTEEDMRSRNGTDVAWRWWAIQWWLSIRLYHRDKIKQIETPELATKVIDLVTEVEHWEDFKRSMDRDEGMEEE